MSLLQLPASFLSSFAANSGMELMGGATRAVSYAGNRANPNNSWGLENYIRLWQNELINPKEFASELLDLGFKVSEHIPRSKDLLVATTLENLTVNTKLWTTALFRGDRALAVQKSMPSNDEVLVMYNRSMITKDTAIFLLMFNFGGEKELAKNFLQLADQIPGPSDLISFAVRDVFSPDIVKTFEYNKELPTAILPWMEKQGLSGEIGIPMPEGSTNTEGSDNRTKAQWFDAYWWAHWQLPAVGQGYEMLQRLYKDSKFGPSPYAKDDTFFTPENLELLQKANDYPPFWRKRLQAIAFRPLGRIDIKRMHSIGVLEETDDKHEVFHAYRQQGYDDINAERLTKYTLLASRKDIVRPAVAQVDKLLRLGVIDHAQASKYLSDLHYPADEITTHLSNIALERFADDATKKLKFIKSSYMQGDISDDQLRNLLINAGIANTEVARYVSLWSLEKDTVRKYVSMGKALDFFKKGFINESMLRNKLTNLHYVKQDQDLLVLDAKNEVAVKQAGLLLKSAEKTAKEQAAANKARITAIANAAKAADKAAAIRAKQLAAISAQDKKAYSEKNIIAFAKANYMGIPDVVAALHDKGWTAVTIERWIHTNLPDLVKGITDGTATQTIGTNK